MEVLCKTWNTPEWRKTNFAAMAMVNLTTLKIAALDA